MLKEVTLQKKTEWRDHLIALKAQAPIYLQKYPASSTRPHGCSSKLWLYYFYNFHVGAIMFFNLWDDKPWAFC